MAKKLPKKIYFEKGAISIPSSFQVFFSSFGIVGVDNNPLRFYNMCMKFRKSFANFAFATVFDYSGEYRKLRYLVASSEEEILDYCLSTYGKKHLELKEWIDSPVPFMVTGHFEWVGKDKKPAMLQVSKPFYYDDPTWVAPEKW